MSAPSTPGEPCLIHILGQGLAAKSAKLLARANGSYLDTDVRLAKPPCHRISCRLSCCGHFYDMRAFCSTLPSDSIMLEEANDLQSDDCYFPARGPRWLVCLQVEAEAQFGSQTELRLRVNGAGPGLLWLEAERGAILSSASPVILLPGGHANLAAEVARLVNQPAELASLANQSSSTESSSGRRPQDCSWSKQYCNDFLADLGLVLSEGMHSSSAAADLAHAWQCCVDRRRENASECSCCSAAMVSPTPSPTPPVCFLHRSCWEELSPRLSCYQIVSHSHLYDCCNCHVPIPIVGVMMEASVVL